MKVKTITYKRIFNLGNYESKHLEETAEIDDHDDPDKAATELITIVERKVRERVDLEMQAADLRDDIKDLKRQIIQLTKEREALIKQEPEEDDIPFKPESAPSTSDSGDPF